MTTALESVDKLTVVSLRRAFNQAAVLVAEHVIKIDSTEVLPLGEEVTFTDADLGFTFRGTITDVQELWEGGEGIVYSCADLYRWLMKEPALLDGTSKINIEAQTPRAAIDALVGSVTSPSSCVLQWDSSEVPASFNLEPINMAGQSVGEWIQRILDQTEDTVCWIEYIWDSGCGIYVPLLKFDRVSNITSVDLRKGDYTVINPEEGDNPLIVGGAHRFTLDGKYHKVCVEGCGEFERFDLRYIPPVGAPTYDYDEHFFTFRYEIPEDWATPRFLDADGNCREDWFARLTLGQPAIGLVSIDQHNLEAIWNPATEKWYWEIKVQVFSGFTALPPPPPVPQISAYFSYTGYLGPLVSCQTASGISESEGRFLVQRPDLFKFTGPSSHDDTALMEAITDRFYHRYCEGPDRSTDLQVHFKGRDPDLDLGAAVVSPELGGPTIREMGYDFRARNIQLGCSDAPLRSEIENAEFRARFNTELGGNWYLTEKKENSCMCGGQVFTDTEDNRTNPSTEGAGGGVESWDCNETFTCVKRDDKLGQYPTEDDCLDDCFPPRWRFIPCVGCVPTEDWADYVTEQECEADNLDPFDPSFNCDPSGGGSGSAPAPSVSGISGPSYNDTQCIGVSCEAGGGGAFFIGFIKRIRSDKKGHTVLAECEDYRFDVISGGFNGWVSWMVSCLHSNSVCIPFYNMGEFRNGLLIEMQDVNAGFEAWTDDGPSTRAFVATPCSI